MRLIYELLIALGFIYVMMNSGDVTGANSTLIVIVLTTGLVAKGLSSQTNVCHRITTEHSNIAGLWHFSRYFHNVYRIFI